MLGTAELDSVVELDRKDNKGQLPTSVTRVNILKDFSGFNHEGHTNKKLQRRFGMFAKGRWTALSLYSLYVEGLNAGSVEVALNLLGLLADDLDGDEFAAANRVYLMARARTLAEVKGKLMASAYEAKEAEVLLTKLYGVEGTEGDALMKPIAFTVLPQKVVEAEPEESKEEGDED